MSNPVKDLRWSTFKAYFLTTFLILNLCKGSKYMSDFRYVRILNNRKFSWIWQGSEYASGLQLWKGAEYSRIPQVYQVSAYASIAQGSEYAWIWLNDALWQGSEYALPSFYRALIKPLVLNKNTPGFRIRQGCEYARVTQGAEYVKDKSEYALIVS